MLNRCKTASRLIVILMVCSSNAAISRGEGVTVDLYPAQARGAVSPFIFGAGIDPKTNPIRFAANPSQVARDVQEAGLRIARFPGGFVFDRSQHRGSWSNFYWQDHLNRNSEGRPFELNDLDTFLQFCERFSIEPLMQINFVGETEESLRGYIEYLVGEGDIDSDGVDWAARRAANGRTRPYRVRYWQLGNEVHCHQQGFHGNAEGAREYARALERLVPLIRRMTPEARILVPLINIQRPQSGMGAGNENKINFDTSGEFARAFLKELQVDVDYFDWHFYPANGWLNQWRYIDTDEEWKHYYCWGTKFRQSHAVILDLIRRHGRQHPPPKLIVGEWSGDLTGDIFREHPESLRGSLARTMASGIYMADILMYMMEQSVSDNSIHAAFWHNFCNVSQELFSVQVTEEYERRLGPVPPRKGRITDEGYGLRHPVYWIFKLLSEQRGELLIESRLQGNSMIDAPGNGLYIDPPYNFPRLTHCATRSADAVYLAVLNKDAHRSADIRVLVHDAALARQAVLHTVGADSYLAENTMEQPDLVKIEGPMPVAMTGPRQLDHVLTPNTLTLLRFDLVP